jgi:hypothetical protein
MATTTWTGVIDTAWGNPPGGVNLNWDTGFTPTLADDVIIDATAPGNVVIGINAECKSLDCTGFTGLLDMQSNSLNVHGSITLGAGMSLAVDARFFVKANGTVTSNGVYVYDIRSSGAGTVLTLGDDLNCGIFGALGNADAGSTLAFGTNSALIEAIDNSNKLHLPSGNFIAFSPGATIEVDASNFDASVDIVVAGIDIPPVIATVGSGKTLYIGFLTTASLTINGTSGIVDQQGAEWDISGNATVNGVTWLCTGATTTVGGNYSITDTIINNGTFDVTATATATTSTITACDFTGTTLTATGSTDGGGNTNVTFVGGGYTGYLTELKLPCKTVRGRNKTCIGRKKN